MKTTVLIQMAWLAPLLLMQCGCQTTKPGAGHIIGQGEAQAEVNLATVQSQAIRQDMAMVAAKAVFQTGDKIAVQIWLKDKISQLPGFPLELDVGESGQVFMPHVGLVNLSGKSVLEVQAELEVKLKKTLNDITVIIARKGEKTLLTVDGKKTVELGRHFIVMGHINRPGLYPLETGSRVRDAIAVAGGVEHYGHPRIYLVRGNLAKSEVKRIDLDDIFYGKNLDDNVLLMANDAIYVAPTKLYSIADFTTLLMSPITSVTQPLWSYLLLFQRQ